MNFFSHHIRSLLHQDHGNPDTELSRHRHNGHPGSFTARMSVANQAEKLSELSVLSDRRPGSLDHFTSQAFISRAGDQFASEHVCNTVYDQTPMRFSAVYAVVS